MQFASLTFLTVGGVSALQAHTFLEIIQCRWGTKAHLVFMFIAFMTNFIVTIMMIMGAVVATHVLTGVNSYGELLSVCHLKLQMLMTFADLTTPFVTSCKQALANTMLLVCLHVMHAYRCLNAPGTAYSPAPLTLMERCTHITEHCRDSSVVDTQTMQCVLHSFDSWSHVHAALQPVTFQCTSCLADCPTLRFDAMSNQKLTSTRIVCAAQCAEPR